jgi:hypothetical protein
MFKKIIQKCKEWKAKYEDYRRLKEFEREFYKEFPRDDDNFSLISLIFALGILLGIIIVSAIK